MTSTCHTLHRPARGPGWIYSNPACLAQNSEPSLWVHTNPRGDDRPPSLPLCDICTPVLPPLDQLGHRAEPIRIVIFWLQPLVGGRHHMTQICPINMDGRVLAGYKRPGCHLEGRGASWDLRGSQCRTRSGRRLAGPAVRLNWHVHFG